MQFQPNVTNWLGLNGLGFNLVSTRSGSQKTMNILGKFQAESNHSCEYLPVDEAFKIRSEGGSSNGETAGMPSTSSGSMVGKALSLIKEGEWSEPIEKAYCKLVDEVFEDAWGLKDDQNKGGSGEYCGGTKPGSSEQDQDQDQARSHLEAAESCKDSEKEHNNSNGSPLLSPKFEGSDALFSTPSFSMRVASVVVEPPTSVDTDDVYQQNNPLGLKALRGRPNVEDVGLTSEEYGESEYETEMEDGGDDEATPHILFTPECENHFVDYANSSEEAFSTPSPASVGCAIKAVEMEGWSSAGSSDPGHQTLPKTSGTSNSFVANSNPNDFAITYASQILASNASIFVCSVDHIPLRDQPIEKNNKDIVDGHRSVSVKDRGCVAFVEECLESYKDDVSGSQLLPAGKRVDVMLARLGLLVHDKNGQELKFFLLY